jgi:type I restriction-modification system DNA methylase subunit
LNHSQIVSFICGVADLIRDTFKRGKYQDVILPLTVLRRLDCVLAPTKEKVLGTVGKFKGKLENLDPQLRRASGFAFYNTSRYDFEKLLADAPHLAANLRNYIKGFSPNMGEVLEKFDFDNTITKLDVKVYKPAKSVADCFKYRNKIGLDVTLEALRDYRQKYRSGTDELYRCAKICRVEKVMQPYLEALG